MPFIYIFPVVLLFCTLWQTSKVADIDLLRLDSPRQEVQINNSYAYTSGKTDRAGVDFSASGQQQAWKLEIDFGNILHFYTPQAGSVYMPVPFPVKDESNGKVTYTASSGSEKLQITLQAVACENSTDTSGFTYKVEVTYKNKTYTGCGQYLFPAERLHDIWALEEVNRRKVPASAFAKGIPTLEIFVLEQKVLGNTGCNTFDGRVSIGKEMIRFSQLTATEMACMGRLEKEFLQALTRTNTYQVESGKLILLAGKSEMLRFRKVD